MSRYLLPFALLLALLPGGLFAASPDEMMHGYHLHKQPAEVAGLLTKMNESPDAVPEYASGFLAGVFRENPKSVDGWLKPKSYNASVESLLLLSLRLAGEDKKAAAFAKERGLSTPAHKRILMEAPLLKQTPQSAHALVPLWGAYFATGSAEYIRAILAALEGSLASKHYTASDIIKVSEGESPLFQVKELLRMPEEMERFLMASSALSTLLAEAEEDAAIKKQLLERAGQMQSKEIATYIKDALKAAPAKALESEQGSH
jgi:hypothetical protein